jgi:hypothetical protein
MGFKAFHSAQATIAGIETAHMIRKGQLSEENMPFPPGTLSPLLKSVVWSSRALLDYLCYFCECKIIKNCW